MIENDAAPTAPLAGASERSSELPASAPKRGETVGRYVIIDFAGRGGMGIVYKAFDPVLNRPVALKLLLLKELAEQGDEAMVEHRTRALREAQALAQLAHPNVVTVFDVGAIGDVVFMAMEFVEGKTLAEALRERSLSRSELLAILADAGHGLAAAHKVGIVHRDFKPSNVLIGTDGRVRVIDFGLARLADGEPPEAHRPIAPSTNSWLSSELTEMGSVIGTVAYMAPEQKDGSATDALSDQFSFSIVLFEALYGKLPFAGTEPRIVRPPSHDVPEWLDRIATRGLAADPKARYPTMDALLDALRDDPSIERARRRAKQLRGAAVVGIVSIVGLSVATTWYGRESVRATCRGAERKLGGVWDAARKAEVQAAFAATKMPYWQTTWSRTEAALDRYAGDWTAMQTEACEAANVRHEEGAELHTLRMSCLSQRLTALRAATNVFVAADAEVVENAHHVLGGLEPIATCADVAALTAPDPLPRDPVVRAEIEAVEAQLAAAAAQERAAKYRPARAIAEAADAQARAVGYRRLESEAAFWFGTLLQDSGDEKRAAATLERSFAAALAARDDRMLARTATDLTFLTGYRLMDPAAGDRWSALARAALDALATGRNAASTRNLEARWLANQGALLRARGEFDRALDYFLRAIAATREALGPDDPHLATSHYNLGAIYYSKDEFDRALEQFELSLAITIKTLGPDHPDVGATLGALGCVSYDKGDYDRALDYFSRALRLTEATIGKDHADVGGTVSNLGLVYLEKGDLDRAAEHFSRARTIWEKALGPEHPRVTWALQGLGRIALRRKQAAAARELFERVVQICGPGKCGEVQNALAEARFGLAQVLAESDAHSPRATELARQAAATLKKSKSVPELGTYREIEAWLARR